MKVTGILEIRFDNEDTAAHIFDALQADDDGYLLQERDGRIIRVTVTADGPGQMSEILDDYLSCMSAARRTLGSITRPRP